MLINELFKINLKNLIIVIQSHIYYVKKTYKMKMILKFLFKLFNKYIFYNKNVNYFETL